MIRKRGGVYHYEIWKDGKRSYGVCHGCTTLKDAQTYVKQLQAVAQEVAAQKNVRALVENFRDVLTGGTPITLQDAYPLYLQKPTKRQPDAHQRSKNRTYWNDFVSFMQEKHPDVQTIANVTRQQAEEYITLIRTSGPYNKSITYQKGAKEYYYRANTNQLANRTINARHKAIKAVFTRLKDDAGLISNPFDIPTLDNETTSREAFTAEELALIGSHMTMPYTKPIFTIGLCTGLTMGDICLLKWSEISGNWITNKLRRKTKVALEIPILPPVQAFLDKQRQVSGNNEYVCPELAKMYLENPSGVFYRVKEFLEGLNIKTTSHVEGRSRAVSTKAAHAMRHTFAYLAGLYSIPQSVVQSVLGHMSPEMTALYQRHAQREQKERFFKNMPDLLGAPTDIQASVIVPQLPAADPVREQLLARIQALSTEDLKKVVAIIDSGLDK